MGHCCSSWPQEWVWRLLQLPPCCEQAGYCPYLTGSLCSLALPRDPQAGANSPGRAHYLPQAVPNPCRPLLPQTLLTHPNCVCCASPAPQPDWASEPCAAAAFASPVAQLVKNLPAMQETWVWPLGWEKSSGEGNRLPTPLFWSWEFHGLYSLWGHKESDMTEQLSLSGLGTDNGMWPTNRGGAKTNARGAVWPKKRKGIHFCSCRCSRLNPRNYLEAVDFGGSCGLWGQLSPLEASTSWSKTRSESELTPQCQQAQRPS